MRNSRGSSDQSRSNAARFGTTNRSCPGPDRGTAMSYCPRTRCASIPSTWPICVPSRSGESWRRNIENCAISGGSWSPAPRSIASVSFRAAGSSRVLRFSAFAFTQPARRTARTCATSAWRRQPGEPPDLELRDANGLFEHPEVALGGFPIGARLHGVRDADLTSELPVHRSARRGHHPLELPEQGGVPERLGVAGTEVEAAHLSLITRPSYVALRIRCPPCPSLCWFVSRAEPLSVEDALAFIADPGAGGTCVFIGTVRDRSDAGDVTGLHYEAWDDLATERLRRDRRGDAGSMAAPAGGDPAPDRGPRRRRGLRGRGVLGRRTEPRRSRRADTGSSA